VCERILMRHREIPLTFIAFDVLSVDGRKLVSLAFLRFEEADDAEHVSLQFGASWRISRSSASAASRVNKSPASCGVFASSVSA
jgi:hypothetical protein